MILPLFVTVDEADPASGKSYNSPMELSFREASSHLTTQEFSNILLWNPKVHYHVHKNTPLVIVLGSHVKKMIFHDYMTPVISN
jgi:hypothetical protein